MTLKHLKGTLVVPLAIGYTQAFGYPCTVLNSAADAHYSKSTLGTLSILVGQEHEKCWVNIWDTSVGKKVFLAFQQPFEVIRCDAETWFDVFADAMLAKPDTAIQYLAEYQGAEHNGVVRQFIPFV